MTSEEWDPRRSRRSRRQRLVVLLVVAALGLVSVLGAVVAVTSPGGGGDDPCLAPTREELSEIAARSELVVRGVVQDVTTLADGITLGTGWLVSVNDQEVIAPGVDRAQGPIAVWPEIGDGELAEGDEIVAYLAAHPDATTVDGEVVPGYDTRLLLLVRRGAVVRLCKDSQSDPVVAGARPHAPQRVSPGTLSTMKSL